jgi:hypothetical protein
VEVFDPCRVAPHECPQLLGGVNRALFHTWRAALNTANGRAHAKRRRYAVRFDGSHWEVEGD